MCWVLPWLCLILHQLLLFSPCQNHLPLHQERRATKQIHKGNHHVFTEGKVQWARSSLLYVQRLCRPQLVPRKTGFPFSPKKLPSWPWLCFTLHLDGDWLTLADSTPCLTYSVLRFSVRKNLEQRLTKVLKGRRRRSRKLERKVLHHLKMVKLKLKRYFA